MKKKIEIEIDCGELTCASEAGKFCTYFGAIHFGQIPVCRLFPSTDFQYTPLKGEEWTLRCEACLKSTAQIST